MFGGCLILGPITWSFGSTTIDICISNVPRLPGYTNSLYTVVGRTYHSIHEDTGFYLAATTPGPGPLDHASLTAPKRSYEYAKLSTHLGWNVRTYGYGNGSQRSILVHKHNIVHYDDSVST
jgi:hypothetical protein